MIEQELVKIKVIGVGGGGGNTVNDMIQSGIDKVEYIVTNTDKQDLEKSLADLKIIIGEKLTRGMGAGGNPSVGEEAAEEDIEKIRGALEDTDMLFITAGMGGGTGTGAAPIIASVAREMGILTVAIVTKPFEFEGIKRMRNAVKGIDKLKNYVDSIVVIPNERLFQLENKSIKIDEAFKAVNDVLRLAIKGIAYLILNQGIINVDFADIKTILSNSGVGVLGFGEGEGENRIEKAVEQAVASPLLERNIEGARKILLNINCADIELNDGRRIAKEIGERAGINQINNFDKDDEDEEEELIWGWVKDETLGDKIQITLIATYIKDLNESEKESAVVSNENKKTETKKVEKKDFFEDDDLDIPPFARKK